MAVKKSELYSSLWEACNKLRGGVEPARYKNYVLVLLFFKYVSDKYKGTGFASKFEIAEGSSFDDLIAAKGRPDVGVKTDEIIKKFREDNALSGSLPEVSFNNTEELGNGKELADKVSGLISVFQNPVLDFKNNRADGDDIIGDAYEYFMMKFAQDSGKSKGQFYTPSEVSRIIARIIGIDEVKITEAKKMFTLYDPACGSGSLLIRTAHEAPINNDGDKVVSIFGQEKDHITAGLAMMNLILHDWETAEIKRGNTLAAPEFTEGEQRLKKFDFVVMNPPFSDKSWSDGILIDKDKFHRFDGYGKPPEKNGDFAWFLHVLKSLNDTGKAAIIMPHGVLFRGNAEEFIRKNILTRKYIKGIISLPANLFYGTGIPACIVLIDKEQAASRTGIFLIDASRDFKKDGNKNRLREQDIERIVQTFKQHKEIFGYSRFVTYEEILEDNGGNLNVPRYIQKVDESLPQNITAHLQGGIPIRDINSLAKLWTISPELRQNIFSCVDEQNKTYRLALPSEKLAEVINADNFIADEKILETETLFKDWCDNVKADLINVTADTDPKALIRKISFALLETYSSARLLDKYDVYDCLLNYWLDKMQDDIYAIKADGYEAGRQFDDELIPKEIIEHEYFSAELDALNRLVDQAEEMDAELAELREENSGEDGLFSEVLSDKGEITKTALKARLKNLSFGEEYAALKNYEAKLKAKGAVDKKIKIARAALDKKIFSKYAALTVDEIKHLLFDLTWAAKLQADIRGEFEQILNALSSRLILIARRYEFTLAEIQQRADKAKAAVKAALERMGF